MNAYESGEGTREDVAEQFRVGTAFVTKRLRLHRAGERLAPKHGGGLLIAAMGMLSLENRYASKIQPDFTLSEIGGTSDFVLVSTVLELVHDDGGPTRTRGKFAGFTDPTATDLNVLGRDVLDNFDLIISRQRNEILLLAPNYRYCVERVQFTLTWKKPT